MARHSRRDPYGVQSWNDGYDRGLSDPNSPLETASGAYFSPPSAGRKGARGASSRYETNSPLPRPPVGRDAGRRARSPSPGRVPRARDSAEMLRDAYTRDPPRRRDHSPSAPRPFQPQRASNRRSSPPPSSSDLYGHRRRSPSPSRRRPAAERPPPRERDRHPPRASHGRPPLDSYTTAPASGPGGRRYSFGAGDDYAPRSGPRDPYAGRGRAASPPPRNRRSPSPAARRPATVKRSNTTASTSRPVLSRINSERWGKALGAAVQAGGLAAYNMRQEPGAWAGQKGAKVGMAALSAAAMGAFRNSGNRSADRPRESDRSGGGRSGGGGNAFGGNIADVLIDGLSRSNSSRNRR